MLELLVSLLMSVVPVCETEDSYSCVFDAGNAIVVNGPENDPGPVSFVIRK